MQSTVDGHWVVSDGGRGDHKGAAMNILEPDFWCTFWLEFGGIMGWAPLQP